MKNEVPLSQVHRLLSPAPACLLTTRYRGRANVMTLAWLCPISLEPPLVLMAVHPATYSHDMLRRGGEAVLNIPPRPLAEELLRCGRLSGTDVDKLETGGLTADAGRRVEAPWIVECLAHVECTVVDVLAPGDHSLFVAEVVGAWAEEEAFQGVWQLPEQIEELVPVYYLGGTSFCLPGRRFDLA